MAFPLWNFSLQYNFLRTDSTIDELKELAGFYLQCRGSAETFYFKDPNDHTVTDQVVAIGDGTNTDFQLIRNFGGFLDAIYAPISPIVTVNDVVTAVTVLDGGVIRFGTAPTGEIKWSGEFYFPCRFKSDRMEFNNFMFNLWEAKSVEFVSVKL